MQPFTPRGKYGLLAGARCDGNVRKLILYNLPKDTNIWSMQIEARIGQHPEVQLIAWWNQNQSRLIRGNLITIPLGNAFFIRRALLYRFRSRDESRK